MKHTFFIIGAASVFLIGAIVLADISGNTEKSNSENNISVSVSSENSKQSNSLSGTWIKEKIRQEDHDFPGDENWQITFKFDDNSKFECKLKQKTGDEKYLEETLSGTFKIEKGFLLSYQFNKPSEQAIKMLMEFFAFWPNKLFGQQTFKLDGNSLKLGFDGHKTWIYLKKE